MGMIFDIQRFSIHDGDGIRTTVFFKGCNNKCVWCHNPESLSALPQLQYFPEKCIGCGECARVCKALAITNEAFDRFKCIDCGECAKVCCSGARELSGRDESVESIIKEVLKDKAYYNNSNGGMTVSGGEPLMQVAFCRELLYAAKKEGLNNGLQTAGNVSYESFKEVLPYLDFIMFDVKLYNEALHKKYTGVSVNRILDNLLLLSKEKVRLIVRTPVIGGINDNEKEIIKIAEYIKDFPNLDYYELLQYHKLGISKNCRLGIKESPVFEVPSAEKLKELTDCARMILPDVRCGVLKEMVEK